LSFGAIALIGGAMLVQRIRGKKHSHGRFFGLGKGHEHEGEHEGKTECGDVTGKELFGLALASGIVPCPGASAVILVCLSLAVTLAGVVAVALISLGMGLTVSAIGAMAILAKRGVIKASTACPRLAPAHARRIVEIAGAAVLFMFGCVFFFA